MPTIADQDRSYRRGLVLGLTMAEIAVLIIFILLLALGAILSRKEKEIEALRDRFAMYQWVDEILAKNSTPVEFERLFEQLQNVAELEARIVELEAQLTEYREIQQILSDVPNEQERKRPIPELVRELILVRETVRQANLPVVPHELEQALQEAAAVLESVERFGVEGPGKLIDELDRLESENQDLRGQLANLWQQVEAAGTGLEMPSCWVTAEGKAEYIFDVALTNDGLIVRDRNLAHRAAQKAELPIADITFNVVLSPSDFRDQLLPLRQWSDANECRFYVRAFDKTGATDKAIYKERMRALEDRFYKYEVKDETFD